MKRGMVKWQCRIGMIAIALGTWMENGFAWNTRSSCMEDYMAAQPLAGYQAYPSYQINYANGWSSIGLRWYYFQTTNSNSALVYNDGIAFRTTNLGCTLVKKMAECGCTTVVAGRHVFLRNGNLFYRKFEGLCAAGLSPAWLSPGILYPNNGFTSLNDH